MSTGRESDVSQLRQLNAGGSGFRDRLFVQICIRGSFSEFWLIVESKIVISVWFGLGYTTKFESTGEVRRESRILRVRVLVSVVERSYITEDLKIPNGNRSIVPSRQ